MPQIKKIAIFAHLTPDHISNLIGLKQGFEALGVDVLTSWPQPDGKILNSIIENYRPDAIIEINRHKDQIEGVVHPFFHVCIIYDYRSHDTVYTNTTCASDLYYSILTPSGFDFPAELDAKCKPFMLGFNQNALSMAKRKEKAFEIGFAGFMGNASAYTGNFMKRLIDPKHPELGRVLDLIKFIGIRPQTLNEWNYPFKVRRKVEEYMRGRGFPEFKFIDHAYHLIFRMCEDGFVRMTNRNHLCTQIIETSDSVAFWGPDMWKLWPKFKPYYQGELFSVTALFEAYSSLKINVHCTGTNLHNRVVDTLASGTPLAMMRNEADDGRFGVDQFLEADKHYISFTFDNFKEKIRHYLDNPQKLAEISKAAKEIVHAKFTWEERCKIILADLESSL